MIPDKPLKTLVIGLITQLELRSSISELIDLDIVSDEEILGWLVMYCDKYFNQSDIATYH